MKRFITYLSTLSIVLALVASCSQEELGNQNAPYAIKSEVSSGRTTSVFKYDQQGEIAEWESLFHYDRYLYDSHGRLIRSESAIDPATLSSGVFVEKTELMTSENSTTTRYQTFSYGADGKLAEIENYTEQDGDFVFTSRQRFEYEGEYITRSNIQNEEGKITQFRTYQYDNRGNVKIEQYYTYSLGVEPTLLSECVYEYDDKNNPYSIFKALGNPGLYTNTNNIISVYSILHEDAAGVEKFTTATTQYFYNQYNYPVKVVSENSEFEYIY